MNIWIIFIQGRPLQNLIYNDCMILEKFISNVRISLIICNHVPLLKEFANLHTSRCSEIVQRIPWRVKMGFALHLSIRESSLRKKCFNVPPSFGESVKSWLRRCLIYFIFPHSDNPVGIWWSAVWQTLSTTGDFELKGGGATWMRPEKPGPLVTEGVAR